MMVVEMVELESMCIVLDEVLLYRLVEVEW